MSTAREPDSLADLGMCPSRQILDRISEKWTMQVLLRLSSSQGTGLRYSSLKRDIEGISQRMLTTTLRALERDGMLSRHVYPEVPLRVEYELTPLGSAAIVSLQNFTNWVNSACPEIEAARERFESLR